MLGERIQRARKALGLSLRGLGDLVALSHAAIKKYEDDEVVPSSTILLQLAKALQVKVEYFFRSNFVLEKIQYRGDANRPQSQLDKITAKICDQIERRVELENFFPREPIKSFVIKKLPKKISCNQDIEGLANQVRHQWNLGGCPIGDLIDLFEEQGIKVFINEQLDSRLPGLSAEVNEMPVIVVGNQIPGDRQRFTLAHELGHLLVSNIPIDPNLNIEDCCDRFAGAFLLPQQSLVNILGSQRHFLEFRELSLLKHEFGISMASILHRALESEIISSDIYKRLHADFKVRGWLQEEPGEQYPQEQTHIFEKMVFHALAEQYIGESKAAELMNMSLKSFRSLRGLENSHVVGYQ